MGRPSCGLGRALARRHVDRFGVHPPPRKSAIEDTEANTKATFRAESPECTHRVLREVANGLACWRKDEASIKNTLRGRALSELSPTPGREWKHLRVECHQQSMNYIGNIRVCLSRLSLWMKQYSDSL
jgi:hypothetical protein